MQHVTIIGAGAVGRSIALALFYGGVKIDAVFSLQGTSAKKLGAEVKARVCGKISGMTSVSDLTIICVPDNAIDSVAKKIALQCARLKKKVIVHTSGALSSDELRAVKKMGACTGSFHPMQTFPKNRHTSLKDVWIALEGDTSALREGKRLAKFFDAQFFTISKEAKVLYHTAGVFASNYVVTLLSVVGQLAAEIKIPKKEIWNVYRPIIEQTLSNVIETSPAEALTGPIARGDVGTVTKHLQALSKKNLKHLLPLYSTLGIETARLAKKKRIQ